MAEVLIWVTTQLNPETMKSTVDGITLGMAHWAEVHDPTMVEGDQHMKQEVCIAAGHPLLKMHATDYAKAQKEDPMLSTVLDWLKTQKKTDLKVLLAEHTSSEEGNLILHNRQNFSIHQGSLYLCSTPKSETKDLLVFVVPKAHCVGTLNGCHWYAGYQGCDCTLSLLQEYFW